MAKEDFCFTYYDGDAARDTTHMNRLERGAYHDLVLSQRKFGHLSKEQIKKVLGRDFDECWPSIELILKIDAAGKFFIEWLDRSIDKMRKHSTKQKENITKRYQTSTKHLPKKETVVPLENGDGYGNEDVIENEKEIGGVGERDFTKPDIEGDVIVFPIPGPAMSEIWTEWKKHRWRNHGMMYKLYGEQADLNRLAGMKWPAIKETIKQAIAGNWKNLYPEKNESRGNSKTTIRRADAVLDDNPDGYGKF